MLSVWGNSHVSALLIFTSQRHLVALSGNMRIMNLWQYCCHSPSLFQWKTPFAKRDRNVVTVCCLSGFPCPEVFPGRFRMGILMTSVRHRARRCQLLGQRCSYSSSAHILALPATLSRSSDAQHYGGLPPPVVDQIWLLPVFCQCCYPAQEALSDLFLFTYVNQSIKLL